MANWPSKGSVGVAPEMGLRKYAICLLFASAMQIGQPTQALEPRGNVTRNPKQGYQWSEVRACECVRQKYF